MLQFKYHSGIYTLTAQQTLPVSLKKAWAFFSNPANLPKITPARMGFQITSETPNAMYAGQIISYKVGIFPGLKSNWVTEITQVNEPHYFIDEQRFGPYAMWHHEHRFEAKKQGVLMTDIISYKIPFGFLGKIAQALLIRKQLTQIFNYREKVLEDLFG